MKLSLSFMVAGSPLPRRLFCSCGEPGPLSSCGAQASRCSGYSRCRAQALRREDFSSCGSWARSLWRPGSVTAAQQPSSPAACGVFPDQGSNLCLLHWQADS